jgi:hypothetical protein
MRWMVAAALVATGAAVAASNLVTDLPASVRNALTTIDVVPTKQQITNAFGTDDQKAKQSLASIATNPESDPDTIGIRLRAIHALAKYCGSPPSSPCAASDLAHQSVSSVIADNQMETTGSRVLILRAAIETLGTMKVSADVSTLVPLLGHPSRDIRAATARALRDLCNPQAVTFLRARYSAETTDQVKLAISEALRILGQCAVQ